MFFVLLCFFAVGDVIVFGVFTAKFSWYRSHEIVRVKFFNALSSLDDGRTTDDMLRELAIAKRLHFYWFILFLSLYLPLSLSLCPVTAHVLLRIFFCLCLFVVFCCVTKDKIESTTQAGRNAKDEFDWENVGVFPLARVVRMREIVRDVEMVLYAMCVPYGNS